MTSETENICNGVAWSPRDNLVWCSNQAGQSVWFDAKHIENLIGSYSKGEWEGYAVFTQDERFLADCEYNPSTNVFVLMNGKKHKIVLTEGHMETISKILGLEFKKRELVH